MTVRLLQTLRNHATGTPPPAPTKKHLDDTLDATESTVLENEDCIGESLETVVVELQHDLRAKSAQCDVLRDTLSAMSNQIQEQESKFEASKEEIQQQLESAKEDLVKKERLLDMKKSAWERSEQRYEDIIDKKDEEVAEWKAKYDDLMLQFDEKIEQARAEAAASLPAQQDALLGNVDGGSQASFSFDSLELRKSQQQRPEDSDDDDDSIQGGSYGELDATERPAAFTNRTRPYRRKKRGHPIKKFKMMPMNWLGNNAAENSKSELALPEESGAVDEENNEHAFNEQMEAMSLADMYTTDEEEEEEEEEKERPSFVSPLANKSHDAELRRRQIRRAAKKKSVSQGFAVEKLEC